MKANLTNELKESQLKTGRIGHFFFIFLSSLFFIQSGFAVDIGKLYEAGVKVEAEMDENELIRKAFNRVLIKVTGRSDVLFSPAYNALVKKAESSISQFRYDYKKVVSDDDTLNNTSDSGAVKKPQEQEKWFWASFNPSMINSLLAQAKIPRWGKNRPATLIWFSQEIKGKRYLQSQYDEPQSYDIFLKQAELRGISLIFPFLDLQDQSSISATDIWGNFNDVILLASKRYQAQSTLTSRLYREPSGLWVSQWSLLLLGETQSWEIRDEQLERVLASGIDELADKLARQFTQNTHDSKAKGLLVQINNVVDFRGFQELDDYLRNLATVKSLSVAEIGKDKVIYRINFINSQRSLIQEIRQDDLLNPVERSAIKYNPGDNDSSYQPVILDGLDKKNAANGISTSISREKALNSMEKSAEIKNSAGQNTLAIVPVVPKKLQPDLEYWLAR